MSKKAQHTRIRVVFILAAILLSALSILSYVRIRTLIASGDLVNHTQLVILDLEEIRSAVNDADTNQKNFLITGDSSMLVSRDAAINRAFSVLLIVDTLVHDNPSQIESLQRLHVAIEAKLLSMERSVLLHSPQMPSPEFILNVRDGIRLTETIKELITIMKKEEDRLLEIRTSSLNKSAFVTPLLTVCLIIGAIIILATSYFRIMRELRIADDLKSNIEQRKNELVSVNEGMRESEERFLKIFDYNPIAMTLAEIKTNKIAYANRAFYAAFGYSEKEVIGNTSDGLHLIGPEENQRLIGIIFSYLQESRTVAELQSLSVEETEELLVKLKETDAMKNLEILYTRKNGETFPAVVSFEIMRFGAQRYTISSYQDITERRKARELLTRQNESLVRANKELESFNFISSHDLQEPLRQIQNFSSRLITNEQALTDKGKTYLEKMNNAAERMRTLITDLLTYSRTTNTERKLEATNLNEIVDEVTEELKEIIEEKHATIKVGQLGKANVILFQFRQMMHNLIGNALKFSKPDSPPVIVISCNWVNQRDVNVPNLVAGKDYSHISVSDNGIGFDPQFRERIFEVFQRVHDKDKFPGTGIGLSIVKKIVENHDGVIVATSEMNKGATFDIYIPVP